MTVVPPVTDAESEGVPLTVVVVDDSPLQRRFVRAALDDHPEFAVVGEAGDGQEAVLLVGKLNPDVVLMDLHLPVLNGIAAIESIMARCPAPILVYSSFVDGDDRENAVAALAAGAVDVLEKPGSDDAGRLDACAEMLRRRLRVAARARVITHPRGRLGGPPATMSTHRLAAASASSGANEHEDSADAMPSAALERRPVALIVLGASTGGPQALSVVLGALPSTLEAAVLVVQHMAQGFIEGLAAWLNTTSALPVSVAATGRPLQPGTVSIAPSGRNLIVHDGLLVTTRMPPPSQHHVPGIDVTFTSVAATAGAAAVGVLLTGMGRDGAAGLKRLRDAGGFTLTQDRDTCAVYGMPAAAMDLEAGHLQLPLEEIGPALCQLTGDLVVELRP